MKAKIAKLTNTSILFSPWVLTFVVFWLYPLFYALFLSFTKYYTLSNKTRWIGFSNYSAIFHDEIFRQALFNTTIFTFGTIPITTALALFLAVLLSSDVKFKNFFRSAYFLPSVTSLVVISLIFKNLYAKDGYISALMNTIGLSSPDHGWLLEPNTALFSIMGMEVWISSGYYMVLFLAALQAIPKDLYEAAELAGATLRQQFWRITMPLIRPTLLFVLVINTIKSFQIFVEIYVMTPGGGPLHSTTTLIYQVYENAFEKADLMGYASAMAYCVFAIIVIFTIIQMKVLKIGQES